MRKKSEKVQVMIKTVEDENKEPKSLYNFSKEEQYICGMVEKGTTGKLKGILDSEKNEFVGSVKVNQAVMSPVFFVLVFSWNLNSLYIITENDAPENIFSDITSAIKASIVSFTGADKVTMKSEIVLGDEKLVEYIKDGEYSQIKIKRKNIPTDIADRVYNIHLSEDDDCTIEVKIKVKNNISGKLVNRIREIASDRNPVFSTIEELEPLGLEKMRR